MNRQLHWDEVYRKRRPTEVSWYEPRAATSRRFIELSGVNRGDPIIDVGGGTSVLDAELLDAGYTDVTVLDVSGEALAVSRARLGDRAADIHWIVGDVLDAPLPSRHFAVWHDRAVFHFLTDVADRERYTRQMLSAVRPGGHVILATFAENGPTRCSGLDVVRYSPTALAEAVGPNLRLLNSEAQAHTTPSGAQQPFTYCLFERSD